MNSDLENVKKDIEDLKRAINELRFFIDIEPEVRQEYVEKLRKKEKEGELEKFDSVDELRKEVENA